MGCRRKNTLCLSLDFGANDSTLLPRLTHLEMSPSPQKRLVLKFPNVEPPHMKAGSSSESHHISAQNKEKHVLATSIFQNFLREHASRPL